MDFPSPKNPQKTLVRRICLALYYLGVGNCWYEEEFQSNTRKFFYRIWMLITNFYHLSFSVNVLLAHMRTDFDEKEQNDRLQFTIAYTVITAKIVFLFLNQNGIKEVLKRVLEGFRSVIVCEDFDKASVKKSLTISLSIVGGTYMAMLGATVDGIRAHLEEGTGYCWHEENPQTKFQKKLYSVWMVISNFYVFSFIINEVLAWFRTDLDAKEKTDLVQFMFAHTVISAKIIFLYIEKKNIIKVLPRLLEGNSVFLTQKLDKACVVRSVRICGAVVIVSFSALLMYTIDGVRAYLAEGVPIRTEVTYYPSKSESGVAVNILRFFIQFHWWFAVSIMAAIDSICISSLVIVSFKFKVLQVYFTSLREKVLQNAKNKSRSELEQEFKNDFVIGIKMHDDALWCAKNVQTALGNLYSVQIFESVVLLVMCLIKLVSAERNLIFLLANIVYILCLIFLTGAYMMPAGDITYEASLVSTSMFHSGWELVSSREVRVLAILALQRSQRPVHMNAFGILLLSYSNFISVIRSSYSFFAVMY